MKKYFLFLLTLMLLMVTLSSLADENDTTSTIISEKAYYSALRFARNSFGLRSLKLSSCMNKFDIANNVESDLMLIRKNLSDARNELFSQDIIWLKKTSSDYIRKHIEQNKKESGNLAKICDSMGKDFKKHYEAAREDYKVWILFPRGDVY